MTSVPPPWPADKDRRSRREPPPPPPESARAGERPNPSEDDETSWEGYGALDDEPDPGRTAPDIPGPERFGALPGSEPGSSFRDVGGYRGSADYPDSNDVADQPNPGLAPGYGDAATGYDRAGPSDPGFEDAAGYGDAAHEAGYGDPGYEEVGYGDAADYRDAAGYGDETDYGDYGYGASENEPGDRPPYQAEPGASGASGAGRGRRQRRDAQLRSRAQAREARWQQHRLAVPYRTDGPRLTFGVLWFALIIGAIAVSPVMVALLASFVAGLAALQTAFAWFPRHGPTRWWAAAGAFSSGLLGLIGPTGVVMAIVVGLAVSVAYAVANPSRSQSTTALAEVAMRAIVPAGAAAASLVALATIGTGAAVALVLLVSAYEMGDFLVGSGSANAVEGPISGLVSVAAVVFILWVVTPAPFTSSSIVLFGVLTGVGCVVGQIFGSALLPRGAAWAPALRRLDSYLLVSPIWVLLLGSLPTTTSL